MGRYVVDIDKYATLARQTAAEGCVLVKNENQTLPLRKGDAITVRVARANLEKKQLDFELIEK